MELVRLQDQIGKFFQRMPMIEMDDILEEVFTIDIDDIEHRAYDERFAAVFGMNRMTADVKKEPNDIEQINETPVVENNQQLNEIVIAENSQQLTEHVIEPTNPSTTTMVMENGEASAKNQKRCDWVVDLTCESNDFLYDENFAKYFGVLQNSSPSVKQESTERDQNAQSPESSSIPIASLNDCKTEVHDPISTGYEFEVDVSTRTYSILKLMQFSISFDSSVQNGISA